MSCCVHPIACISHSHRIVKIRPHPVRSAKSSTISPSQYCGGGPRGNPGCCIPFCPPFFYFRLLTCATRSSHRSASHLQLCKIPSLPLQSSADQCRSIAQRIPTKASAAFFLKCLNVIVWRFAFPVRVPSIRVVVHCDSNRPIPSASATLQRGHHHAYSEDQPADCSPHREAFRAIGH
jgi:hypothetical protein